ncbi:venom acid phosphatase Acph-1 [Aethina tumida]|uniref:venom acid phosphatase Acph-1 n=1 Tax=Aethina tumida TaxID=116153 RepID=UPI00096AF49F|nr:venom acid phosphatase Acph-1 [Aethina tumida]
MHIYGFLLFALVSVSTGHSIASDLKLVHVFFRHGSRTPEEKDIYPTDPYKLEDFQPMGWGQLTNVGKQRAFKLGKLLRKRYDSFLGKLYVPDIVMAQSTDYDRTKMSALLALAGLFKPAPSQIWDEEVTWLPIPYSYLKDSFDYQLRRPNAYCPTYLKELEEARASAKVQTLLKENKKLLTYIARNAGKPINTLDDVFGIYQTLCAEKSLNLTIPDWAVKVYDDIETLSGKLCELENSNDVLKKLNGGRMLGKVIEQMIAKSEEKLVPEQTKIYLYSGHENNVINILAALDLFKPHVPKYSAAVIIELHYLEDSKRYGVKVYYSRDVNAEPEEQQLPGCDVMCPLSDFIQITKPHVPTNFTEECHSNINLDI